MADVVYRFRAVGADSVAKAYETIGRARKAQVATEREANAYARQATRSTGDAAKAQQRATDKANREAVRAEARKNQELARERKKGENEAVKDGAAQFRRLMQERAKARAAETRDREASLQADKRHRAKSEAEALSDAKRESRKLFAERAKARKEAADAWNDRRAANMRGVRRSNDRLESLAGGIGRGIYGGLAGAGAAIATGAIGLTGGAARSMVSLQDVSRQLSVQSRANGGEFVDPSTLSKEFLNTAVATPGQKASDIAEAASVYVGKTGDLGAARRFSKTFATTASASGGQVQDIAAMAASIGEKFGIRSEKDMQDALASVYFQGKSGAFELKDAAGLYDKLTAAGARFGLDQGVGGVRTLGGLTQIARGSTGSSEQAAFAVEASLRQLVGKSAEIKSVTGVDVFTDKSHTKAREVTGLMKDVIAGAGGDQTKLQKIFGEEGIRGVSGLITAFNQGQAAAGKNATETERTAAGMKAMDAVLQKAIGTGASFSEVQKDAAFAQQSTGARLTAVWETLTATVGPKVLPQLESLASRAGELAPVFEYLAGAAGMVLDAFLDFVGKFGSPEQKADVAIVRKEQELNKAQTEAEKKAALVGGPLAPGDPAMSKVINAENALSELKDKRRSLTPEGLAGMSDAAFNAEVASRDMSAGSRAAGVAAAGASLLVPGAGLIAPLAQANMGIVGTMQTSSQRDAINNRSLGGGKEVHVDPTSLIGAMKAMVDAFSSASASLEKSKQGNLLGG